GRSWRSRDPRTAARPASRGRHRPSRVRPARLPAAARVLSDPSARLSLQQKVGAAGLKAGEVDGHVDVAKLAQARHDCLVAPLLPETRHVLERDLQARQPVVVAHAELAEAERADEGLGLVHLAELLGGDLVAVLKA